ncbi:MAG TPA: hypothetical protein PK191_04255 [Niabella sp.]|nr:hypothetical protein [Niabella sp.]HOZ97853.1 hypothetical protein [Niabella sp.]HQW15691.1 hypothetical protein [Niabella sp.]HQX20792.1 hypothetical protein [Niabella sp.]HRB36383.1 hypothetical protein [Niabella sp.]
MENPFISNYQKLIDENYDSLKNYFLHQPHHFLALESLRNEILQNLLLNLFQTAIFGTNHLLERLIKLSLIEKHTLGLNYSNHVLYNQKTIEAIELYDSLTLNDSLKAAYKQNLITELEKNTLMELRKKIRNPFSHAEIKKIINDAPPKFTGFMFNINDVKESLIKGAPMPQGERKEITTLSSTFSQLYQKEFSEQIALDFFETVYSILINIDNKLQKL